MSDRDVSAIATWTRHDQGDDPGRQRRPASRQRDPRATHVCASGCALEGDYMWALQHHVQQAHEIRIKNGGPGWPNIDFPEPYCARMRARLAKQTGEQQ